MKVAIVSTVKCPASQLHAWVNYHLDLGIDEIILFFDNPLDHVFSEFSVEARVTAVLCTNAYWEHKCKTRPDFLPDRQIVNVNEGATIAQALNCQWLAHIDCDEVIQCLIDLKQALANASFDAIRFSLLEAVAARDRCESIFTPRLFRKKPTWLQVLMAYSLGCSSAFYEGGYFRGHQSSKMLV